MKVYSDNKMEFRTAKYFGRKQIPVVIVFMIIAIWSVYITIFKSRDADPLILKISGVVLMCLFIYQILIGTSISWFTNIYYLTIEGNTIWGFNLFDRPRKLLLEEIRSVRKEKCWNSIQLLLINGKKVTINSAIDFNGFIFDYIIERLSDDVKTDLKSISKLRNDARFWKYTRGYPFKTQYPPGYLEWFLPIAEKQKAEMIARGILKPGVLYGQDEKHVW